MLIPMTLADLTHQLATWCTWPAMPGQTHPPHSAPLGRLPGLGAIRAHSSHRGRAGSVRPAGRLGARWTGRSGHWLGRGLDQADSGGQPVGPFRCCGRLGSGRQGRGPLRRAGWQPGTGRYLDMERVHLDQAASRGQSPGPELGGDRLRRGGPPGRAVRRSQLQQPGGCSMTPGRGTGPPGPSTIRQSTRRLATARRWPTMPPPGAWSCSAVITSAPITTTPGSGDSSGHQGPERMFCAPRMEPPSVFRSAFGRGCHQLRSAADAQGEDVHRR